MSGICYKSNKKNCFKYSYPLSLNISLAHLILVLLSIAILTVPLMFMSDYFILKYNFFMKILHESNIETYTLFDIFISIIFLYYLIKNELTLIKKTLLIFLLILVLITLYYLNDNLYVAYHLFILFALLPFFLNIIANHYLLDMPFWLFLNIHTYTCNEVNLFTNTKGQKEHHRSDAIYIDLFYLNQEGENKELKDIANEYLRLIKFWYSYENYRFKIRYFFPILGLALSVFIYLMSLYFIYEHFNGIEYLSHISIMAIYLLILFFSINLHANNFLSSKFYMGNILKKLNKIYFDQYEYKHQLKLFLDKNFLVYIHDRNYDQELCVNTSKSFQKFISKETLDKEGRNSILTIFITFIMIFLIEVLVNVKHTSPTKQGTENNVTK